jgi:nucleoid-associated protein YgaU
MMDGLNSGDFAAALLTAGTVALKAVAAWALVVAALSSWPRTVGMARAMTPPALRFLVGAGLTGTMTLGGGAHAGELDGLRLPDRPASAANEHVVQPGDSLWSIAAHDLGPDVHTATVAEATGRWYDANQQVIGPDPNLIHPGQRLVVPEVQW